MAEQQFRLLDPQLLGNLTEAQKRQAMAQALVNQSQQPIDTTETAGGFVIPKTMEILGQAVQGFVADRRLKQANTAERDAMVAALRGEQEAQAAAKAEAEAEKEGLLTPAQVQTLTGSAPQPGYLYYGNSKRITEVDRAPRETAGDKTYKTLTPDEVKAAGLPEGTVAQRGSDGRIEIVSKVTDATQGRKEGAENLDTQVATLRDFYDQLEKGGGITSTDKAGLSNVGPALASSGLGQATGRLFGTQNQSIRNSIAQQRPLLLQAIKNATGMTAKQMDSNVELKLYLAAATDPTLDVQANRRALDNLLRLFGSGDKSGAAGADEQAAQGEIPAPPGVDPKLWQHMTPEERALWK